MQCSVSDPGTWCFGCQIIFRDRQFCHMAAVTCYYGRGCGSRSRYGSGQNVDAAEYVISFSIFFHVFVWLYADEETAPLLSVSGAGRRRGDPFCRGGYRISHVCVVLESEPLCAKHIIRNRFRRPAAERKRGGDT